MEKGLEVRVLNKHCSLLGWGGHSAVRGLLEACLKANVGCSPGVLKGL